MHDRDIDERARRLSERVDALGRALGAAGVDSQTASRLLEAAATAALHALTLELLADAGQAPASARVTEPAPATAVAEPEAAAARIAAAA